MTGKPNLQCVCGSTTFFECVHVRGTGGFNHCIIVNGRGIVIDVNPKRHPLPKTVRCTDCDRKHPNPRAHTEISDD